MSSNQSKSKIKSSSNIHPSQLKEEKIPLIECTRHNIKCKYFCTQKNCPIQTKIACSECMFEGQHQSHEYIKFEQLMKKIKKVTTQEVGSDKMMLEIHIKETFKQIREAVIKELEQYEQYFLEQIMPLNLSKIMRLSYSKLTGDNISQEDIHLIKNLDQEINLSTVPLFVKNQINEYLDRLKDDTHEYLNTSMQPFALKKQQISEFKQFKGIKAFAIKNAHDNHINSVEILSKNNIVTASSDKTLKVYDLIDKKQLLVMKSTSAINKVIKVDDKILVSGHKCGRVMFWNWSMETKLAEFVAHESDITDMQMLDVKTLITCSTDASIKFWDVEKGSCVKTLQGHTDNINSISIFDEYHLLSASNDFLVKSWNLEGENIINDPRSVQNFRGHTSFISSVITINQDQFASGDVEGKVFIWNYAKQEIMFKLEEHTDKISSLLRINNVVFASCSEDGTIIVTDPRDSQILHHLQNGHSGFITNMCLSYEQHIISVGLDKRIVVWE